jgi:hypothetical protein
MSMFYFTFFLKKLKGYIRDGVQPQLVTNCNFRSKYASHRLPKTYLVEQSGTERCASCDLSMFFHVKLARRE